MSALARLAARGRLGREVAARLDIVGALGPRHALAWRRANAELARTAHERRTAVYREIWSEAATLVGAELEELTPDVWEIHHGRRRTHVRHQTTSLDGPVSIELSLEKVAVHRLLSEAGIRVPEHVEFDLADLAPALDLLSSPGGSLVIKPAAATGAGWGVTAGIKTADELGRAAIRAARFGSRLLAERQVHGHVHRLLVLDGAVVDTVRRHPPRLIGDGRASIERLVDRENLSRMEAGGRAGLAPLRLDLDALLTLARAGLSPRSVPVAGRTVVVKTVTQQNRNEDNETVHEPIASNLAGEVADAADVIGLRLAGVDVIAPDLSRSLAESGGVVLEVNGEPGLHHHYHVADPSRATRVAAPVLERALASPIGPRVG